MQQLAEAERVLANRFWERIAKWQFHLRSRQCPYLSDGLLTAFKIQKMRLGHIPDAGRGVVALLGGALADSEA